MSDDLPPPPAFMLRPVTVTPMAVFRGARLAWIIGGFVIMLASAVLGGVASRSFNAGASSEHEIVMDKERQELTKALAALTTIVTAQTAQETSQGFINRSVDKQLTELQEHVHELDGRATALTSRADVADGRYSVLADRAQQQPPPSVTLGVRR